MPQRTDLKPLEISQPEGVSFTLDGNELRWQNWSMRLGFNFREGPVIYQVAFDDQDTRRDIAYRMSFAEMVVPYRDPGFDHYRRTAFDIGEWGLGYMTTSLELGCDCLGEIVYVDAVVPDSSGRAAGDPAGHLPPRGGQRRAVEARRRRDRGPGPSDAPDGRLGARHRRQLRVPDLLAVLSGRQHRVRGARHRPDGDDPAWRSDGDSSPYGTTVDTRTYAPFHQHFLVAKLDLDIDGEDNTVVEVDSVAAPISEDNPYGLGGVHPGDHDRVREPVGPRLQLGDPAGLEGDQPRQDEPARHATPPTSWCPGRRSRRCWTRPRRSTSGPR